MKPAGQPHGFVTWFAMLRNEAHKQDAEWLLGDREATRDFWENGLTPAQAIEAAIEEAQANE